jgi:flavin-dependent dehydrogenase
MTVAQGTKPLADTKPPGDTADCDVLVVGGGPGGSTISALLAQRGWSVVQLEKEHHPRFHIGESLLPMNLPIFERLGVLEQVRGIGIVKRGADFNSHLEVSGHHQFDFSFALDRSHPYAWEVRRSEFDELLFRNSAAKGVNTIEGTRATAAELVDGQNPRVHTVDEHGRSSTWEARFLVDASGRDTLLGLRLGLKARNRRHASAAMFGHFENVERRPGEFEGNISVYWFEHGWFWMIPLRDGAMSIGAVCRPEYLKRRRTSPADYLMQTIASGHPEMRQRMRDARLVSEVRATGNYSYSSSRMRGERWVLVGDAYAFVDPVFSSGVYLAMSGGGFVADAVDAFLRGDRSAEKKFAQAERRVRLGIATFSWFIERFNTPGMRKLMLHPGNPMRVQEAVISLLAGDIYRNIGARWRFQLIKVIYHFMNWSHPLEAWRQFVLGARNLRVVFTGGTTPLDTQ